MRDGDGQVSVDGPEVVEASKVRPSHHVWVFSRRKMVLRGQ
jgi:hypothetical protein